MSSANILYLAYARFGEVERVKEQLRKGADPYARDKEGKTALHWAHYTRQQILIDYLQTKYPSLADMQDKFGQKPNAQLNQKPPQNLKALAKRFFSSAAVKANEESLRLAQSLCVADQGTRVAKGAGKLPSSWSEGVAGTPISTGVPSGAAPAKGSLDFSRTGEISVAGTDSSERSSRGGGEVEGKEEDSLAASQTLSDSEINSVADLIDGLDLEDPPSNPSRPQPEDEAKRGDSAAEEGNGKGPRADLENEEFFLWKLFRVLLRSIGV